MVRINSDCNANPQNSLTATKHTHTHTHTHTQQPCSVLKQEAYSQVSGSKQVEKIHNLCNIQVSNGCLPISKKIQIQNTYYMERSHTRLLAKASIVHPEYDCCPPHQHWSTFKSYTQPKEEITTKRRNNSQILQLLIIQTVFISLYNFHSMTVLLQYYVR